MQAKHSLEFARAPAVWSMYPKIMVSRKPSLVPDGGEVPRIESRLAQGGHRSQAPRGVFGYLRRRRRAPRCPSPIHTCSRCRCTWPCSAPRRFPVKLFGLVHVQNRIAMREPLSAEEPAEIRAWIEGHRDTERGQEFDLHTEYVVAGEPLWDETCTFLARKQPPPGAGEDPMSAAPSKARRMRWRSSRAVFARRRASAAATASSPAT